MPTPNLRALLARSLAAAATLSVAGLACADTVFSTPNPVTGPLGYRGYDVYPDQSVGARFTPTGTFSLDRLSLWFMSNDQLGATPQTVTVTLRTDANPGTTFTSVPSGSVLESWTMDLPVAGYNPELIAFDSVDHPALNAGQKYWVVAESSVPLGSDPIWVFAPNTEFTANTDGPGTPWESGSGSALGLVVLGTLANTACPADVGIGGGLPGHDGLLDNNDFIAFINYFFAQSTVADMGMAAGLPGNDGAWDNNDFIAFINHFFDGCDA